MPTATMTSKGQVTVPKEVREQLGLNTGSVLDFIPYEKGYVLEARQGSIRDLFGMLPKPAKAATLEEMDDGIVAGAAEAMNI